MLCVENERMSVALSLCHLALRSRVGTQKAEICTKILCLVVCYEITKEEVITLNGGEDRSRNATQRRRV